MPAEGRPAPDRPDLAALARQVAAQRAELDGLRADVHSLLGRVDQAFGRLGAELAALRAGPPPPAADAGTTTWVDLAGWVAWLHGRYPLGRRVPPCWWRHPAVVRELAALRSAAPAGRTGTAAGTADLDWHERLPAALDRIAGWLPPACLTGDHADDPPPPAAIDDPEAYPDGAL